MIMRPHGAKNSGTPTWGGALRRRAVLCVWMFFFSSKKPDSSQVFSLLRFDPSECATVLTALENFGINNIIIITINIIIIIIIKNILISISDYLEHFSSS